MTISSSVSLERGLDTMIVVYSLLQDHPAAVPCTNLLCSFSGWFTTPLAMFFEAKNILTKVYGIDPAETTRKLQQFAAGPVAVIPIDEATADSAFQLADSHNLDLTDSVLLTLARKFGSVFLATDDQRLMQACGRTGHPTSKPAG